MRQDVTGSSRNPLSVPDYRRYLIGRVSSIIAINGMIVIMGYQLYDIARSDHAMSIGQASFLLGMLGLVQFLPLMVLSPFAGVLADRFERRTVGACAMAVDLAITLILAAATQWGHLSLWLIFVLGGFHGAARAFVGPALSAIVPNVVPAELMPRAVATSSVAWQIGAMLGPTSAGFLFAGSRALPYWLGAALLIVAIISVMAIRPIAPPPGNREEHPVRQILAGLRFVRGERFLLGCITLDLFAVILGGATALLPVFARDILQVGPEGLGQLRAAPAMGAMVVGLFLAWRPMSQNVGAKMLWAVVVYGAATLTFGLSRDFLLSLAMLALLGAGDMISMFVRSTLIQLNTPDAMRGRVQSISGLAVSASNELGEMQSGIAAAILGATGAVVFGGVGAILITVLWAVIFPELRNARTFASQSRQRELEHES